jgi:hypothetical protein
MPVIVIAVVGLVAACAGRVVFLCLSRESDPWPGELPVDAFDCSPPVVMRPGQLPGGTWQDKDYCPPFSAN